MIYSTQYASPLGAVILAAEGERLIGLWFDGQKHFGAGLELVPGEAEVLDRACDWLNRYFAGARPSPGELPLGPRGTEFQRRVWARLCEIPYGETVTYGELARGLGSSARAVGGAVGRNPISIVIPCHRVTGAGGDLTGYAGGIERKQWLLSHETLHRRRGRVGGADGRTAAPLG